MILGLNGWGFQVFKFSSLTGALYAPLVLFSVNRMQIELMGLI